MTLVRNIATLAQLKGVDAALRAATAPLRGLPDFLIVGEAKCGTTSLYTDLARHPRVVEAMKEVHFFDLRFHLGLDWYRAQFPLDWSRASWPAARRRVLMGEASPYYMYHPHAPARIKQTLPHVKLIAMLRNPTDRAYSQYQHEIREGRETLTFEEAIEQEPVRLAGEVERMLANVRYKSKEHRRHSYLARGIYADRLAVWWDLFPREQLLILKSEEYFKAADATVERVQQFLGLEPRRPKRFARKNVGGYAPMSADMRERLNAYFAPHNERLYQLLGADLGWSR
jgi:Sulfotransferase domain